MRGEHVSVPAVAQLILGSSPHARGAPARASICQSGRRIIPACAGSTRRPGPSWVRTRDHPRMRGEHVSQQNASPTGWGSSPHARGAPLARAVGERREGIIPACAGSTRGRTRPSRAWRDHPRMRGEHKLPVPTMHERMGSSPHARGARRGVFERGPERGIIPACAGSTRRRKGQDMLDEDHPRMRGEHSEEAPSVTSAVGSSPHARGALRTTPRYAGAGGIIPACAGSTTARRARRESTEDHPRMRGEHSCVGPPKRPRRGSSPHARGARKVRVLHAEESRIIPACAGSTAFPHRRCRAWRDHPRMRGEHTSTTGTARPRPGSSPHARGARSRSSTGA